MSTACFDTLILSDLHLGSEVSRAKDALQMLKAVSFRRLILLGDIFCDLNFRRLKKEHWQFLSYIRKLSNRLTKKESPSMPIASELTIIIPIRIRRS